MIFIADCNLQFWYSKEIDKKFQFFLISQKFLTERFVLSIHWIYLLVKFCSFRMVKIMKLCFTMVKIIKCLFLGTTRIIRVGWTPGHFNSPGTNCCLFKRNRYLSRPESTFKKVRWGRSGNVRCRILSAFLWR